MLISVREVQSFERIAVDRRISVRNGDFCDLFIFLKDISAGLDTCNRYGFSLDFDALRKSDLSAVSGVAGNSDSSGLCGYLKSPAVTDPLTAAVSDSSDA